MDEMHPSAGGEEIGSLLVTVADVLADVLDAGELDDVSRRQLGGLYRALSGGTAALTTSGAAGRTGDSTGDAYWHHVGSFYAIQGRLPLRARSAIWDAGAIWLDELDELDDRTLRAYPGVGIRTIAQVRRVLDLYYWRAGRDLESRALWLGIVSVLQSNLELAYLRPEERKRIVQGLAFADRVISDRGKPLADSRAPRLAVTS